MSRVLAAVLVLSCIGFAVPRQGAAASAVPLSWSAPQPVRAPGVDLGNIEDVSCPTSSFCVAVAGDINPGDPSDGQVLTSVDPTGGANAWRATPAVDPAGLLSVSCPTTTFCAATDGEGGIATSTDPAGGASAWTTTPLFPNEQGLVWISCPSAHLCVAIAGLGSVVVSTDPTGGAGAWAAMPPLLNEGWISGLSCPTTTLCVAIDPLGAIITSTDPAGGPSAWTETDGVDASVSESSGLDDIDCPSVQLCVATDRSGDLVTSTDPSGGADAWTVTPNLVGAGLSLGAVSCPSTTLCVATADDTGELISTDPTGGAAAWTVAPGSTLTSPEPAVMDCPTTTLCVGIGAMPASGSVYVETTTDPTGDAAGWSVAMGVESLDLTSVSCPTPVFCAGVGPNGYVVTSTDPTGGAGAWNVIAGVDPPSVASTGMLAVSCPTAALCVAVGRDLDVAPDGGGDIVTSTDPTGSAGAWKVAVAVDDVAGLNAISCPSAKLCVAVDDNGGVLTSTDPTGGKAAWRRVEADGKFTSYLGTSQPQLTAVSCPSVSFCVAADGDGNAIYSSDPTGGADAWTRETVAQDLSNITSISCPSESFCLATTDVSGGGAPGNDYVSTDPAGGNWPAIGFGYDSGACASESFCVLTGDGNVATSENPAANGSYVVTGSVDTPVPGATLSVSCPTLTLCVAGDYWGNMFIGTPGSALSPAITADPVNETVAAGSTARLAAGAYDSSSLHVAWQVQPAGGSGFGDVPGATSATYSFEANASDSGNRYRAVFTGSSGRAMTTAATVTVTAAAKGTRLAQSIAITSTPPRDAVSGDVYAVDTEATSGLPVSLSIDAATASVCSIAYATVTFHTPGACLIDASQPGDDEFLPATPVQQTVVVQPVPSTPAFVSAARLQARTGNPVSFTVRTSGFPAGTIVRSGALPKGVAFAPTANGTATISGTPAARTGGSYPLTLTTSNFLGDAKQAFTLVVLQPPLIVSAARATARVGSAFTYTVKTSGFPACTISKSGALPKGLSFSSHAGGTATISGTPATGTRGTRHLTLAATNSSGRVNQTFTLTILPPVS